MTNAKKRLLASIHHLSNSDKKKIEFAFDSAVELHKDQKRDSGEPYAFHPIEVAIYLANLEADCDTLIAALLHDTVEDGCTTLDAIEKDFGKTVTKLIDGVTKLEKIEYEGKPTERQIASLRKLLLTASEDLRVIFIKLADRWHNISTLSVLSTERQERIALETLEIYVPFARLFGLWELKIYFEARCFPIAYPKESKEWNSAINHLRTRTSNEYIDFVHRVNTETTDDVAVKVTEATDYELFQRYQGNLERMSDVDALDSVLLLLKNTNASSVDCYRVLGEIHKQYRVRVGMFRDFISIPKPNGYTALHTSIFLNKNRQMRLRIQTQDMYQYSNFRKLSSWLLESSHDVFASLSMLHKADFDSDSYVQDLQETVLERINVFTTAGEIISLPINATGIDFAYTVSPNDLAYLSGILVNGILEPAIHTLKEGDIVEIVLAENGESILSSAWVGKAKSIDAKEGIKKSLKNDIKYSKYSEARSYLETECTKRKLPSWSLFNITKIQKSLSKKLEKSNFDDVLEGVGTGTISVDTVLNTYKEILAGKNLFSVKLLRFFGILPKARVLDRDAKIMNIEIVTLDRTGMIFDITKCFAEQGINISKFGVFAVPPKNALYKIRLEVQNFNEFSNLFDLLLLIPNVKEILRK